MHLWTREDLTSRVLHSVQKVNLWPSQCQSFDKAQAFGSEAQARRDDLIESEPNGSSLRVEDLSEIERVNVTPRLP